MPCSGKTGTTAKSRSKPRECWTLERDRDRMVIGQRYDSASLWILETLKPNLARVSLGGYVHCREMVYWKVS